MAPIRRWVLYSRRNLALTLVGIVVLLIGAGHLFGATDTAPTAAHSTHHNTTDDKSGAGGSTEPDTSTNSTAEVSEGQTKNIIDPAAESAPALAMRYAHAYLDYQADPVTWQAQLTRLAPSIGNTDLAATRPAVPVLITGPTHTSTGTSTTVVTIPTSTGQTLRAVLVHTGTGWALSAPLPALDLTKLPQPATDAHNTATAAGPTGVASANGPTATAPPGPIPIPDLDTPLPGAR